MGGGVLRQLGGLVGVVALWVCSTCMGHVVAHLQYLGLICNLMRVLKLFSSDN
jgi:hypothetical protein